MAKYTAEQYAAMCQAPWRWSEQLRAEAKRRGIACTSVTPIAIVASSLRKQLEGK